MKDMSLRTCVFAVAVESYLDPKIPPVAHAENDARKFVEAWQALGADAHDCVVLVSGHATVTALRSRLKIFLQGVQPGDRVIFFYAGHGAAFDDNRYLTAYDTQSGDLQATSLPLSEVLQALRHCAGGQVLLFADARQGGLPVTRGMPPADPRLLADDLTCFCADYEARVAFAACQADEVSFSSPALRHGIWSHCLIEALTGQAPHAFEKGAVITGASLQRYLKDEVPRILRATLSGPERQTPCSYGNGADALVVADLCEVLAAKASRGDSALDGLIKESLLIGEDVGSVRSLRGFNKRFHQEPDRHSSAAGDFIQKIGCDDVKEHADQVGRQVQQHLGYKRRDVDFSCGDGAATIKTPDFDVNITISQDKDDPGAYVISTEVGVIRRSSIVKDARFLEVFTQYCDTLVIKYAQSVDVNQQIDDIEEVPELAKYMNYAPGGAWFKLLLDHPRIEITGTRNEMTLKLLEKRDLKTLLARTESAFNTFTGAGLTLLSPRATGSAPRQRSDLHG